MAKQAISLRRAAVATIVAALLSLPMPALAQTDQPAGAAGVAKPHPQNHKPSAVARKGAVGAPLDLSAFATNLSVAAPPARQTSAPEPEDSLCPNGYTSHTPPCMSTFPQADPNYHGPGW